jgi:hypothetical protein
MQVSYMIGALAGLQQRSRTVYLHHLSRGGIV